MAKSKNEDLTYDTALIALQKILDEIQNGQVGLEEMATNLTKARELAHFCKTRLRDIELDVEKFKKSME
ncbi:MAG: exodeoxyribonuclease VII small subunit [Saprospiraceae bacterium]